MPRLLPPRIHPTCCGRYTPSPDYSLPDSGSPTFVDFAYNNITFPEPQQQLQHYKTAYNMRFGGIRKPRLGNRSVRRPGSARGSALFCALPFILA
jgi:alpha-glucosidase (family GH31 glycosyl hydrolase)